MATVGGKKGTPPPEPGSNKKFQKPGGQMQEERDRRVQDQKDREESERFEREHPLGSEEEEES